MIERRKPRPRDPLQLANLIGDIARFSALTRTRARRRLSASQMTIHGAQSRSPSPALFLGYAAACASLDRPRTPAAGDPARPMRVEAVA